ncbi:MAG: MBL fold metallo-hydrolase [Prevotellaceae bacterium]|nr:MBL fold metallo-hydrolase [Prevotellaceae bacterium]
MQLRFMSLASGSSGNCYYLGTERYGILIDAGIAARRIKRDLKEAGIGMEMIHAVFLTHDHLDHVKSVGTLGEKLNIPIYATRRTHEGIDMGHHSTKRLQTSRHYIEKGTPLQLRDFHIEAFEVPHDGTDNVGYCIEADGKTFTFATDLGEITPTVATYLRKADYLILEANYDEEMLRTGSYPAYLKERIAGANGHLSNRAAAEFIADNMNGKWRYIWLCHLSKDNNLPELAHRTVAVKLAEKGITVDKDVRLTALQRNVPTELYLFE